MHVVSVENKVQFSTHQPLKTAAKVGVLAFLRLILVTVRPSIDTYPCD